MRDPLDWGSVRAKMRTRLRKVLQIVFVFALIASLADAGECGSRLFASKEKKECCNRGKCAPSKQSDDCCQIAHSSSSKPFVTSGKSSIPNPLHTVAGLAAPLPTVQLHAVLMPSPLIWDDVTWLGLGPPLSAINLPLLI